MDVGELTNPSQGLSFQSEETYLDDFCAPDAPRRSLSTQTSSHALVRRAPSASRRHAPRRVGGWALNCLATPTTPPPRSRGHGWGMYNIDTDRAGVWKSKERSARSSKGRSDVLFLYRLARHPQSSASRWTDQQAFLMSYASPGYGAGLVPAPPSWPYRQNQYGRESVAELQPAALTQSVILAAPDRVHRCAAS